MPAPPPYDRQANFVEYAAAHTSEPYNPADHDAEFDAIEQTLDQLLVNIALIQRDDGQLRNQVVGLDSLSPAVSALITASGGTIRGAWLTGTAYAIKDVVTQGTGTYICAVAHTAGTFATDLAAGRWVTLFSSTTLAASGITFTPTGGVGSGDVQAAIAEVDSEKLSKADNLGSVADRSTAFNNIVAGGGTMTGALNFSGARINEAQGADIASAGTINLDTATGNLVDVTGTTAITAITLSQGREAVIRFTGVLTLTHGASLVLPGAASITTAAGDFAVFRGYAAGVVRCVTYSRADGAAVGGSSSLFRNRIINGAMRFDQRGEGTAFTITAGAALLYTLDRWYAYCTGANVTLQQVASGAFKRLRITGAASVTAVGVGQRIEAANSLDLAGGNAMLQVRAASTSLTSLNWALYYANTTDAFGTLASPTRTLIASGTFTISSSEGVYSASAAIPSAATTGLELVLSAGALLAAQTLTIGDVQIEAGASASAFERVEYATEKVRCLRYYEKSYPETVKPGTASDYRGSALGPSLSNSLGGTYWTAPFSVEKRTTPTLTMLNPSTGTSGQGVGNGSGISTAVSQSNGGGTRSIGHWYNSGTALNTGEFGSIHWVADAEL